ncbi:rRNA pseudouridine synthase [Rhizobiaceae bacterium]|nr:rRNA pseudouridine synthase [Rhizobiaceae bacterium]
MSKTTPTPTADDDAPERIAKRMARAGLCSRRDAERWIEAGRVAVNGKLLDSPAFTVTMADRIEVDGAPMQAAERTRLWLHNKRSGTVTTARDPQGRRTLFETLPKDLPRVLTVGRLDINTEGLLLLTNDGGLARALELPSTGWLRRYRVRAHGTVKQEQLDALKDGVAVDGVLYGSIEAELERVQGTNVWLTFAMREGKNREVKNVLASLDLDVNRLIRISYGPFQLGDLPTGGVVEVRSRTLRDQLGEKLISAAGADFETALAPPPKAVEPLKSVTPKGAKARAVAARRKDPLARLSTRAPQKQGVKKSGPTTGPRSGPKRDGKPGKPGADRRR